MGYQALIIIAVVLIAAAYILIAFSKGKDKVKDLTGESGIALSEISAQTPGRVKISGSEYAAVSSDDKKIPKSSKVTVKKQDGDKVIVEAVRF